MGLDFRPLERLIRQLAVEETSAMMSSPLTDKLTNEELAERAAKLTEIYEKHKKLLTDEINKIMDDIEVKTGGKITNNVNSLRNTLLSYPEALKAAKAIREEATAIFKRAVSLQNEIDAIKAAAVVDPTAKAFADLIIPNPDDMKTHVVDNRLRSLNNETNIKQLQADVSRNSYNIDVLRKEHRQGIAQMAAMASVDFGNVKARTIKVGAAVGHYKNQSAIAVGAAIAPNDRWLINTKVANSGKDFSVGLGATYEFNY